MLTFALAGASFISTLAGGVAALRWSSSQGLLFAFAGGVVLGAAVFDLLPEAVDYAQTAGVSSAVPYALAGCGFIVLRVVERFLHQRDHELAPARMGVAGAMGFTVHSFFDGLAIGLGFQLSEGVGVVVALAVIGHDAADGLNVVSYLRVHGQGRYRQRRWLLADACAPLLGAALTQVVQVPTGLFPVAVGFFSGVFISTATTALLPRALSVAGAAAVPAAVAGAALMFAVTRVV